MMRIRALLRIFTVIVLIAGCDEKPSTDATKPLAGADAGEAAAPTEKGKDDPAGSSAPEWADSGEPSRTLQVVQRDGAVTLVDGEKALARLVPTLVTKWSDAAGTKPQFLETPLEVTRSTPSDGGGFALYMEGKDALGTWKIRAENGPGDPRLKFALSGKFARAVVLHEQSVVFTLPGEEGPEVLGSDYRWETVEEEGSTPVLTPGWIRWPDRDITLRAVAGIDRIRASLDDGDWSVSFDTYAAERHPFEADTTCGKSGLTSRGAAQLAEKTKVEARWQLLAGTPQPVIPTRYERGMRAAFGLVIEDYEPDFDRAKVLGIGKTRNDSDAFLDLAVLFTLVTRPDDEGIKRLGGFGRTMVGRGAELAPSQGPAEAELFRPGADTKIWFDEAGTSSCDAVFHKGWTPENGALQERLTAGFRYFWDGSLRQTETPGMLGDAPPFYSYPHSLERGSPTPWLFEGIDAREPSRTTGLITEDNVDAMREGWEMSILVTRPDTWLIAKDDGWIWDSKAQKAMIWLGIQNKSGKVWAGPVGRLVGHAVGMSNLAVEYSPNGWVRVRNLGHDDLRDASFLLPEGASAVFANGSKPERAESAIFFDLPGRSERLFRVVDSTSWPETTRFELKE